jgi:Phage integrase family
MPQFLLDAITDHSVRWKLGATDVLCRTPRGSLLRRDYYNREIWKPAIATTGLPEDATFHDLRHTFASTALAQGVPISEVSRWLGHKSITTTVDLYGHLVPEASGRARDALDNAFPPSADVPPKCPRRSLSLPKRRSAAGAAGEPACRPGSVTPRFLTCHYSPGRPSGLHGCHVTLRDLTGLFGFSCAPDVRQAQSRTTK